MAKQLAWLLAMTAAAAFAIATPVVEHGIGSMSQQLSSQHHHVKPDSTLPIVMCDPGLDPGCDQFHGPG